MTTQTWQQACDCKGTTATVAGSRFIVSSDGRHETATTYSRPVCDFCDTPWTLAPLDPKP